MKYLRTEVNISEDILNATDNYLLKKDSNYEKYTIPTTHNDYQIVITLRDTESKHFIYNEIIVIVVVYKKVKDKTILTKIAEKKVHINKITELCSVFWIAYQDSMFMINVDKKRKDTIRCLKDKLYKMKEKIDDNLYIRNLFIYSDLSKQRELMNICYLLIANNNLIKFDDDFRETVQKKLNYYGYIRDSKEYNKDLFILENMNNSDNIIKLLTGRILFDIDRFDEKGRCLIGDIETSQEMEDIAFNTYEAYIDSLYKEGLPVS